MLLKINPFNNKVSNSTVNQSRFNVSNQCSTPAMSFCSKDQFVKKAAMPLADAMSEVFKAVTIKGFKEIELPIANPEPLEIIMEKLSLKASKSADKLSIDVAYEHPGASGTIPVSVDEFYAAGYSPKSKTGLIDSVKKSLVEESNDIRFDRTTRMDDIK